MNTKILTSVVLLGASALFSCSGGPETDPAKVADSTNSARIDSAKQVDTTSINQVKTADLKQDAEFAVAAADGGMLEVSLGKMAQSKGSAAVIKKLGAQMVKDHSKANLELKTLAAEKQIVIPKDMSDKCQKIISDLQAKNGKDFDKAYADLMVSDHKEDIDEFKKEADKGTDAQVTAWAKSKIPTLEHHLMMAEEAQKTVDK